MKSSLLTTTVGKFTYIKIIPGEFPTMLSMGILKTTGDRESIKWGKNRSFVGS